MPPASNQSSTSTRTSILSTHLHTLLSNRLPPKTICPSEVARRLSRHELAEAGASSWRDLMDDVRSTIWEMRARDEVQVLQKGEVLEGEQLRVEDIKGPIRVRATASYLARDRNSINVRPVEGVARLEVCDDGSARDNANRVDGPNDRDDALV